MVEQLPADFLEEIKEILTDAKEYEQFLNSFEKKRAYGLRYNPLLGDRQHFLETVPFACKPVAWAKDGYYCDKEAQPGKHFLHEAGAYYIQEPSAMAVAELLEAQPGEVICDLCAAPGGKSTQIAAAMKQEGLLVANEIVWNRAKILSSNMERMGVRNAVVCNETPDRMAQIFPAFFDKILVDAPCSGEGMFRKDPKAIDEWSKEQVSICRQRQLFILEQAAGMLRSGGILVYSTCTFNAEEDEKVIETFLKNHEEFEPVPVNAKNGIVPGGLAGTIRLWPHRLDGEGHFAAKLRKKGVFPKAGYPTVQAEKRKELLKPVLAFEQEFLQKTFEGTKVFFGEELYLVPERMRDLKGIKIVRAGLHLGTNKKNRFEPAHALAASLRKEEVKQYVTIKDPGIYLKGESFSEESVDKERSACEKNGWAVCYAADYPLGLCKYANGVYKNHYPKGLRLQF
ncbi:MAG: hypothetical protein E7294_04865 [Lachnospiraceae bacterium]|jgi:NOL1/NOP2/sun family putative RNA methylase|nr:hypothetical protein [Lachnospiraceae bacterium]